MRRRGRRVALARLIAGLVISTLAAPVLADELSELRQQLAAQHKVMQALESRMMELEAKEKERTGKGVDFGYAAGARKQGFAAEDVYDNGFFIRSKDGRYSLTLNGFLQARYTLTAPAGMDDGRTRSNFDVALARLAFSGNIFDPKVKYFFQYEATTFGNSNQSTMLDWWMQYSHSQYLNVQAGRFILPYSRQFYTHPGNLLFSDLSVADYAFNLQRAVGANLSGRLGKLSYHAVVTNSIRALDAGGQQNMGNEVAWQGRLEYDLLEPYGYLESSPTPAAAPQLSLGVAAAFNPVDQPSRFQNVYDGDRTTNVTVDGGFRYQGLSVQAAGYYRRNNRDCCSDDDGIGHDWGYYGQVGYYLTERLELAGRSRVSIFSLPTISTPRAMYANIRLASITTCTATASNSRRTTAFWTATRFSIVALPPALIASGCRPKYYSKTVQKREGGMER